MHVVYLLLLFRTMDGLKENTHWMLQYFDNSDKQLFIFLHPKMYRAEIYA